MRWELAGQPPVLYKAHHQSNEQVRGDHSLGPTPVCPTCRQTAWQVVATDLLSNFKCQVELINSRGTGGHWPCASPPAQLCASLNAQVLREAMAAALEDLKEEPQVLFILEERGEQPPGAWGGGACC